MAGYFQIGETKIRPGSYFNVQKREGDNEFGSVDGVVAVLFRSSMGPLGTVQVIEREDGYEELYGTGGTTDTLREALYGGAQKIIACRIGSGGSNETVSLSADTGKVKITSRYPGKVGFSVTVREKLADASQKECVIYIGTEEYEKVNFAVGENEVQALLDAFAKSKNFSAELEDNGEGTVTCVSQEAFTAGTDPAVTNGDYSKGLEEIEKYFFNTVCVDTEDNGVHELVSVFLDRIYNAGRFGIGVVAGKSSMDLDERMAAAASFDKENIVYVLNANVITKTEELDGYQTAALIAGMIAACPAGRSLTHTVIDRCAELKELLTNSQYEKAILNGSLALSYNTDDEVWIESANNTMIHTDENHDEGWKKIRRVKTRYELMYRANAQADALAGKVDNDINGRATIIGKLQKICNAMVQEGKLVSAEVTESEKYIADTDSCWFNVDVVDKDSAEHIYLLYKFGFSTRV